MSSTILVRIDDSFRLAGTLLAASDWPDYEQTVKAYMSHRTSSAAHKHFADQRAHPAVVGARAIVGNGDGLGQLYTHALNATWPANLPANDFLPLAQAFWAEHQTEWQAAEAEANEVVKRADLGHFIDDLLGPQTRQMVFVPNLLFPGKQLVGAVSATETVVAIHPPIAWGSSHPWKYNERADEVFAKLSEALARTIFDASLPEAHSALRKHGEAFSLAAAVLFLRQAEGDAAGDQFMVMEKKTRGIKHLPAVVAALEPILADRRAGKYTGLADYAGLLTGVFPA